MGTVTPRHSMTTAHTWPRAPPRHAVAAASGEKQHWENCEGSHRQATCGWGQEPGVSFLAERESLFYTCVPIHTQIHIHS